MSVRVRKWKDKCGRKQEAWLVDVQFEHSDGRVERVRKASPVNTRRGAEAYERELRRALLEGRYGKEVKPEDVPTVAEFAEAFLTESENNNKPSTVAAKRQLLESHLLPHFGPLRLDAVGPAQVEAFKAQKRRDGLGAKTVNNALVVLHRLLSAAQEHGLLAQVPRVRMLKAEKPPFDFLTFEEAERLVVRAEAQWRTMVLLALHTGLRRGELVALRWEDVDLVAGRLVVRRNVWRGNFGTPKGGRAREVPLSARALEALQRHRHLRGPFVFCDAQGAYLKNDTVRSALLRACKRAGLREVGWHTLRHTFASHLVMRGAVLKSVQELLGHASLEMTLRYAHLSPDVRRDAVGLLDAGPSGTYAAHGGR